ncbi:MAG: ribosome recycling factor [Oscillospiraceae bacterium]|jgi:ribosome recycling factor|nr:ribosome recycling factor [Oscillospiraceae bacterium]
MNEVCEQIDVKMEKILDNLSCEYATMRAGRANPSVLDKVLVDYYGVPTPVQQMSAVSVSEARILVIQPWDKSMLKEVERAIQASDIGINPSNDGDVIRIVFPPLTEDRRREICKKLHKEAEDSKVSIRAIRRDAMEELKEMKRVGDLTEDDVKLYEKDVQNLTDRYCKGIDVLCEKKEKEVMEI